ncbi:hypothetical protein HYS94_04280 [Candidatus Daviesbacteria bacterium]|nr:hypothetical protein [Candidatus Daviesbacteria bacterium]
MPTITPVNLFASEAVLAFFKIGILLILIFYAIFALMIVRQVDLMGKTLITPVSPILRAFAIVHAGVAIGLVVLAWGIL